MGSLFRQILSSYTEKTVAVFHAYRIFWIFCAFILLFSFFFYLIGIGEQQRQIRELRSQYTEKRKQSIESTKVNENVQKYLRLKDHMQVFRKKLPEENNFRNMENEISALIQKNGLNAGPVELKPEGISEMLLLKYISTFTVSGPYAQLRQFLADMQNLPELYCIDHFSFRNRSEKGMVDMELSISTYFRGSMKLQPLPALH